MARFFQPRRKLKHHREKPGYLCALVAAGLALAILGCSKSSQTSAAPESGVAVELPKVRFKTDWYAQAEHGGFYQAVAKGYYKKAGIIVDIVPGGPGVLVPQVVLAGQVDIAMGSSDDLVMWASKGLPFVCVGVYMERDPQALLVHDESPVRTFADLNHRTIMAVQGVNWIEYLKAHYKIDFNLIPSNFGIAQFMADKDFIQQCFVTDEPYYVAKNGGHPRTILIADSGFDPYRVIYTTQRYLSEHPAEVRAFVAASMQGWDDFMNGDPSPAKALIAKDNVNMTDEFMNYSIKAMRDEHIVSGRPELGERLGLMTHERMQAQAKVLFDLKIIPELIPLDRFVRFDFMPPDLQPGAR
jgi:NitT/TauT family transport system substrate-binding protein